MIFLDTETCGLHGPIVLIQYSKNFGEIVLHNVWKSTIHSTIELIEEIVNDEEGVVGFNLAFDWFHLCQTYTTLIQFRDWDELPENHIEQYAIFEERGRFGPCLKPKHCFDIMLHARKGPYQSTMNREDIKIKKIPTSLAWELAEELSRRIPLKDIYFSKKGDKTERWTVADITNDLGEMVPDFKDLYLRFAPSSALKVLAQDALGIKDTVFLSEISPPKPPEELGYAPFALAIGKSGAWNGAWPQIISAHISYWSYNSIARKYASDDVLYTRELYKFFGHQPMDDDDSILACMVAAVRWRGFAIDIPALRALRDTAIATVNDVKHNFNSPDVCRKYLEQVLGESEKAVLRVNDKVTTKKMILEEIAKWRVEVVCTACNGVGCEKCEDGLVRSEELHPAAKRASEILGFRHAQKEVELYDKLLQAGRFHASFNVIGALSTRMSGGDGLNPQGINKSTDVRSCFPLADGGLILGGGDFDAFEVNLMDAAYGDPDLRIDLMSGKKIHALFGQYLFPPMTYDEIMKTKGLVGDKDKYARSKNGVFALAYGGEAHTLHTRVGIPESTAEEAYQRWIKKYKVWGEARKKIFDMFCSMRQTGGIGSRVEWAEPSDYIESMFGFKRYFTLENQICKALFELAEDPPKKWQYIPIKVVRRERIQTVCGALRSALFAAAFAVQAGNMRAAANHVIQSSGATLTKMLQVRLWGLQPAGIYAWRIQPMNVHDEIMAPAVREVMPQIKTIVESFLEEAAHKVPLIEMKWKENMKNWGEK